MEELFFRQILKIFFAILFLCCFYSCEVSENAMVEETQESNDLAKEEVVRRETWLAAGQSNMQRRTLFEEPASDIEGIFSDNFDLGFLPLDEFPNFAAVPGYFSIEYKKLKNIDMEIIAVAQGASPLPTWRRGGIWYKDRIEPFLGMQIHGIIWWQGESEALNNRDVDRYGDDFVALIQEWREDFALGEIPFIFVQLQNYDPCVDILSDDPATATNPLSCDEPESWAQVRAEQAKALVLPQVSMIQTSDITFGEVHPAYSYEEIGQRLALTAFDDEIH